MVTLFPSNCHFYPSLSLNLSKTNFLPSFVFIFPFFLQIVLHLNPYLRKKLRGFIASNLLSIYLSPVALNLSILIAVHLSIYLNNDSSIYLSLQLLINLSFYLSISLSLSLALCLSFSLSSCLTSATKLYFFFSDNLLKVRRKQTFLFLFCFLLAFLLAFFIAGLP